MRITKLLNKKKNLWRGRRIRGYQSGLSLIETIIVLVVISIAAAGVLSVFVASLRGSADPLILSQATGLAQGEMEQIIGIAEATGFGSIAVGSSMACSMAMPPDFTCRRDVYYVDQSDLNTAVGGPTNYKHVTVTVSHALIGDVGLDTLLADF